MLDFTSLPASEANDLKRAKPLDEGLIYTFTKVLDEEIVYKELNERLKKLESATASNVHELNEIRDIADEFKIATDEKEVILLRCNWLEKLYKAEAALGNIKTKEDAEKLKRLLQMVQSSPFKKDLLEKIASVKLISDSEKEDINFEEKLMNEAIKMNKPLFSNIGIAGREHVLSIMVEKHGKKLELNQLIDAARELEDRVKGLSDLKDTNQLKVHIAELPIINFSSLSATEQEEFVNALKHGEGAANISDLQRKVNDFMTSKMNNAQNVSEQSFTTSKGEATNTINIENGFPRFIQEEDLK